MRRSRFKLIVLLLLVAFREPAMAEQLTVDDTTRSEIAALVAAEDDGWNRGSAEAFADRALPEIVFTNIVGMFSVGEAPFVERHAQIFRTIFKGSTNHQAIQQITMNKPDVAIVDTLAVLTGRSRSRQAPSSSMARSTRGWSRFWFVGMTAGGSRPSTTSP